MKIVSSLVTTLFLIISSTAILYADAITFEATVNTPKISLEDALQLTLTITGVQDNIDPINLPALDGFSVKYLGPSTSVSIVNGDYHSERSFIYNLFPNKVGHFQIPAISTTISGQTYTTKPIDIDVFETSAQAQSAIPTQPGSQGPTAQSLNDKIKIILSVDKNNVYLNERVPMTIRLLVNNVPMRDIQFSQFNKQGFDVDDFQKPEQYTQVIDGINYDVVDFKTYIYPNQLGDIQVGPVQIEGNVVYQTGQDNPFGQNNPFGTDVFNNFFDSYATRAVTVTSSSLHLNVTALPTANRPDDFSGAVGQSFDFQASVSPLQVKAGDPITLKMDVKGNGNFKNLKMPVFQDQGFKTYAPQIKGGADEKTAQEVIIPTTAGITQVPALRFSYFDTSINDYKTIAQGPFTIQVTAPSPDQEFKAIGFTDINKIPAVNPANQYPFGNLLNKISKELQKLFKSIWFWFGLGFILAGAIAYYFWRRFQERLENDPAFARRLKALNEAKKALGQAQEFISASKSKDFYGLITKVVHDYLANKWHQSSAALSNEEILGHLKSLQIDDAHVNQIKTLLEQSDMVCFAGANRDASQMQADLAQTQNLISYLEQRLK